MRVARRFAYRSENFIGIDLSFGDNPCNGFLNHFIDKIFNIIEFFLGKSVQGE